MKKGNTLYLFIAIVTAMSFSLTGCKDKSVMLVRTWKLDNLHYTKDIPEDMKPQIEASIAQLRGAFTITYYKDGTYISGMPAQQVSGTWKLNMTSTKITSTTVKGEKTSYDIQTLTDTRFTFKAIEGKEEVIFEMVPVN